MIRSTAVGALALGALFTLAAVPANADATGDVRAAMLRLAGQSSYEMAIGTGSRSATIDYVKPHSMHMRTTGTEMVFIDSTMYVKMGGTWRKLPGHQGVGPGEMAAKVREMTTGANALTATDLGMKTVDGESLHAYRMKQSNGTESTVYIARDGLCHRIDGSGKNSTVRFSKFNAIPPIHAPM